METNIYDAIDAIAFIIEKEIEWHNDHRQQLNFVHDDAYIRGYIDGLKNAQEIMFEFKGENK